jgi:hypothetical protein
MEIIFPVFGGDEENHEKYRTRYPASQPRM